MIFRAMTRLQKSSSQSKPVLIRYIEGIKKESEILKKETKLISEAGSNWSETLHRNREQILKHIRAKVELLEGLEMMLQD